MSRHYFVCLTLLGSIYMAVIITTALIWSL